VVQSEGVYCWDHKGGKLIDGSSGLFCCPAGHGRKEIADAVHEQMTNNDYVACFGLGHPGAFALSEKICRLLPANFNHVFFTNSGSESIDSAIKIVLAYHRARGEGHRIRLVSRERAYHGVNMGGVSLAGMVKNRETFALTLPNVSLIRHTWDPEELFVDGQPNKGAELADDLERIAENMGGSTIAAVFVEPIAGSTGILVPPKGYLQRLRKICDKHGILLVFDEVITGFGRTGKGFAAETFGVTPDIITMAKALTNGTLPMGAVGVSDDVYDTIVNSAADNAIEFFHGYTYSGHPAACAAGLATLKIYEDESLFDRASELAPYFREAVYSLRDHPMIKDIRCYGLLAGIEVHPREAPGKLGAELQKTMFWNGMHIKFTGDNGILAPAFIAEHSHIDEMVDVFRRSLDEHSE